MYCRTRYAVIPSLFAIPLLYQCDYRQSAYIFRTVHNYGNYIGTQKWVMFREMSDKNIAYYGALLRWLLRWLLRRLYCRVFTGLIDICMVHNYGNYMGNQKWVMFLEMSDEKKTGFLSFFIFYRFYFYFSRASVVHRSVCQYNCAISLYLPVEVLYLSLSVPVCLCPCVSLSLSVCVS